MSKVPAGAFALLVVACTLLGGFVAAGYQYQDSAETDDYARDTVVVDYNNTSYVEPGRDVARTWLDDPHVENESGGNLTAGTDYSWDSSRGAIDFFNTSNTTDTANGENATVEYGYIRPTDEAQTAQHIASQMSYLAAMLVLVVPAIAVVAAMVAFARAATSGGGPGR